MSKEQYSLDVGATDLARMTMLGNIYKPDNIQFIINGGLSKGMEIADVGCGPGNMSIWFAKEVGPSGSVTAIDSSEEQLDIVKAQAAKHQLSHLIPKKLDIYELSNHFEQQFDIVFCRFLIIHLHEPLKAIEQMIRILKPNGRLIIAEIDNETWYSYPPSEAIEKDIQMLNQLGKARGIDIAVGKKLYTYFKDLKLNDIKVTIAQPVLEKEHREYLINKVKAWGKRYLEHQLMTQAQLDESLRQIKQLVSNEDYLLVAAKMFQVSGTKTPS